MTAARHIDYEIMNDQPFPIRKPTRSHGIDYSRNGTYFITVCSQDNKYIFSRIIDRTDNPFSYKAEVCLSQIGKIVERNLLDLERRFSAVSIDRYVIMPNHIHFILVLFNDVHSESKLSVNDVVCAFKSNASREINKAFDCKKVFQRSYYDHVVRNRADYEEIVKYIVNNPASWIKDKLISSRPGESPTP